MTSLEGNAFVIGFCLGVMRKRWVVRFRIGGQWVYGFKTLRYSAEDQ